MSDIFSGKKKHRIKGKGRRKPLRAEDSEDKKRRLVPLGEEKAYHLQHHGKKEGGGRKAGFEFLRQTLGEKGKETEGGCRSSIRCLRFLLCLGKREKKGKERCPTTAPHPKRENERGKKEAAYRPRPGIVRRFKPAKGKKTKKGSGPVFLR